MIWILTLLLGCENKEPDMLCNAVCMAESSYTYTTELDTYLLEASISTLYGSETISFEYSGTEEEQYGESSGVIMMLKATGFEATAEYELDIEGITINGEVVSVELTDSQEKEECGGTCDAKSFSISTDDTSSVE